MALLTATQARVYLAYLDSSEDTLIDTMIARATSVLAAWCGWPRNDSGGQTMEASTYTFYLDAPTDEGAQEIAVPVWPLVTVTSVYDDPERAYGASTLVSSGDYDTDLQAGRIILKPSSTLGKFSTARRALKVTVSAGYSTAPADLAQALGMMVKHLLELRHTQGASSVDTGDGAAQRREEDIPAAVKQMLRPYTIWVGLA